MSPRRPALVAALAVTTALLGVACSDSAAETEVLGATELPATTTPATTTPAAGTTPPDDTVTTELLPPVVVSAARPVGRTSRTVVDPTRPTTAIPGVTDAAPDRTIPVLVLHPAAGSSPGITEGAPPATDGPFPLVVVSHGLTGSAEGLLPLLQAIAEAGYVVVSPDFPETTGGTDFAALPAYEEQPADVSVVLDAVLADPDLAPMVDPDRIAAGGHSLGGLTTYGLVFHDCCTDERIDAAFTLAGARLPFQGEPFTWVPTPLLLVHGEDDALVPFATSAGVFDALSGPGYLLTLLGEDHSAGLDPADPGHATTNATIVAFLDRWLREDPRADTALTPGVVAPGVAELRTTGAR
ncbi:MAG: dienelactone hydrolase family protein [Acidimicrobiales bacterium]|jgi:predicted dienelactone hydrolase|nr:dienelactone hydrolase family protein [Acidimicrobiales bacterium]